MTWFQITPVLQNSHTRLSQFPHLSGTRPTQPSLHLMEKGSHRFFRQQNAIHIIPQTTLLVLPCPEGHTTLYAFMLSSFLPVVSLSLSPPVIFQGVRWQVFIRSILTTYTQVFHNIHEVLQSRASEHLQLEKNRERFQIELLPM